MRPVLVPRAVVCTVAQMMHACRGFRLRLVGGRSRAGWVALCHHTEFQGEGDWRIVGAYTGEGAVSSGEESVMCCIQQRDEQQEEVEASWARAGFVTALVRVQASRVAVRVRSARCMSGGFPTNWAAIVRAAVEDE